MHTKKRWLNIVTLVFWSSHRVVELTGDVTPDMRAIAKADLIVTTPEKWDGVSRSWQNRSYVQKVAILIIDEIHLLGERPQCHCHLKMCHSKITTLVVGKLFDLMNKWPTFICQLVLFQLMKTNIFVKVCGLAACSRGGQGSRVGGHCVQDQLHLLPHLQRRPSGGPLHGPGQCQRPRWLAGNRTSEPPVCHIFHRQKKNGCNMSKQLQWGDTDLKPQLCLWLCRACTSCAGWAHACIKWTACSISIDGNSSSWHTAVCLLLF